MLIVVLLVALVLVAVVIATIAAVLRDDRGAIAEDWAYDTRRPLP